MYKTIAFLLTIMTLSFSISAQDDKSCLIKGQVMDLASGEPIEFVTVYVDGKTYAAETSISGKYSIKVPAHTAFALMFSRVGYKVGRVEISPLSNGDVKTIDIELVTSYSDLEIVVRESKLENNGLIVESVKELKLLPSATGNLESVLPHLALGTSSGTGGELSSQYNVRGGNYDENLVYVNDFEIYRPQLIRSGQQEGLTFANFDLIRDLSFSSGGFEARYGDKLSSVLDIKYKRPDSLRASVGLSFLGGSAHIEGSKKIKKSDFKKFRYLLGYRYKTTKYVLGGLDVEGEYAPAFHDLQGYFTYDINRDWQVGVMGNLNSSVYNFKPESGQSAFGLFNYTLQLNTAFTGSEQDVFNTYMGGVSLSYVPDLINNPYYLKFLVSTYQAEEQEKFDIIGDYVLGELDTGLGSETAGEVTNIVGIGTQHQYARNLLINNVTNVEHKGGVEMTIDHDTKDKTHFVQWSAKYQHEYIFDKINDWERLDSAGYSVPFDSEAVQILSVLKSKNTLNSDRFSSYLQDSYTVINPEKSEQRMTLGVRATYWTLNNELLVSPRFQYLYKPLKSKRDISYKFSTGLYYQPPYYRELRKDDGTINKDIKSQKSLHFVGGIVYDFYLGKKNPKPFKIIMEAYYKSLWDLVSYEVDNVKIDYSGVNDAKGYVTGLDFRINGEFVPGAESWINLSFLRAREQLTGVQHKTREIGASEGTDVEYVPRPTDRAFTASLFFQDYLKRNKNLKTHVNLSFGTGLPYGLRGNNTIYRNPYRYKIYHRVDIGFSLLLWDKTKKSRKNPFRFTRASWLSLEVYNLMDVSNESSKTWIKTIFGQQYAVSNHLTSRRVNLRLKMEF